MEMGQAKSTTQTVALNFFAETEVNMLKFYFSSAKAGGSYSFTVTVSDGDRIVYHKLFPLQTFHQFVQMPYEAKAD